MAGSHFGWIEHPGVSVPTRQLFIVNTIDLQGTPPSSAAELLALIHLQDYRQRQILRDFLLSEKTELENALDSQRQTLEELLARKSLYELYMKNCQQGCFNTKVKKR